jgi:hypothetical protein
MYRTENREHETDCKRKKCYTLEDGKGGRQKQRKKDGNKRKEMKRQRQRQGRDKQLERLIRS